MQLPDLYAQDTIAALATPPGAAALAIIRMSGPRAIKILQQITGKMRPWRHAHTRLVQVNNLDEFMCTVFFSPHSYTGEDTVEISCHGNPLVVERFMQALLQAGARQAMPGEFTYRAVRNGKMTLEQAERIAHRLHARLPWELDLVEHGTQATKPFADLLRRLRETYADLESAIEFAEGNGPDWEALAHTVRQLAAHARLQDRFTRLPRVVLAGAVNTGKSTLFNCIAGYERALVSEHAGTTRDWLETEVRHQSLPFVLIDSAGLRDAPEGPEADGIRNTQELIRNADIIVAFSVEPAWVNDDRVIFVSPKADTSPPVQNTVPVSGKTGQGIRSLLDEIVMRIQKQRATTRPDWWFSTRFLELAYEIEARFLRIDPHGLPEIQAEHVRELCKKIEDALDVPFADLYDMIFSRFCIGK